MGSIDKNLAPAIWHTIVNIKHGMGCGVLVMGGAMSQHMGRARFPQKTQRTPVRATVPTKCLVRLWMATWHISIFYVCVYTAEMRQRTNIVSTPNNQINEIRVFLLEFLNSMISAQCCFVAASWANWQENTKSHYTCSP